ncbi:RICIN domain-containing protein [Streptomyces sp. NPDC056224]|uniref:RICIN domain-containing protein n=1 Tax=Streptomyces sp. NPDC056224 TaxID=3345750 RepID=UPI0035DA6307
MTQTAADEDPLVLRAFRTLSPASQQALCPEIAEAPEHSGLRQTEYPGHDTSFTPSARTQLCEAYLRTYVAQAPSRTCRHLTAAMDDTLQGGVSDSSNVLAQHTTACRSCSDARTNLAILRSGSQAALTGLLLDAAQNAAIPRADTPDVDSEAPTPAAFDVSTTAGPGSPPPVPRPRSRSVTRSRASLLVAAVSVTAAATAVVTVIETTGPSDTTPPPPAHATIVPTVPAAAAATTASPAPSTMTPVLASSTPSSTPEDPMPDDPTPEDTTPTPSSPPIGFPLVNRATGLCVGAQSRAAGAALRLEECRDVALQRWETFKDASGAYQLRNTGSDKCLDGTEGGGNIVRAVLNDCGDRSSSRYAVQLWRISKEKGSDAFRLQFVPRVASSDYSSHLFGPEDWWNENPPREGSYLAHLPNYYNSESFVFTMNHGE